MIAHILATAALVAGTLTDFDHREVPNWITMGLIASGLIIAVLTSISALSWTPLIESGLGILVAFILSAAMYYTGQWGGADGMLLMGIGSLFGIPLSLHPLPFFIAFLFVGLFAGAAYGILYLAFLVLKKRKVVGPALRERLEQPVTLRVRKTALITMPVLVVLALLFTHIVTIMLTFLAVFGYMTFLLYHLAKAVENSLFTKEISVERLVPGDWVIKDVKKGKTMIVQADKLKTGLEPKHIAQLKKHKIKSVTVLEGIPFVPSFLIAYVFTLLYHQQLAAYFLMVL